MSQANQQPDRSELPEEWQRGFDWVERTLGGKLVGWKRQNRWRPAWFLTLERDGESVPLYWRGARGELDHGIYDLKHEGHVLEVLRRNGIPVAQVYGYCEDPEGLLLESCPGRANLATAENAAEVESVVDDYVEVLTRMHAIDVKEFEDIGLTRPQNAEQLGLGDFDFWERQYRADKVRPDPLVEFGIRWVRRNTPQERSKVSFLHADAGQFLFDKGHLTTVIDLELGYLGDPAADIAGMRARDISEPLGDLKRAVHHYEALSGEKVDPAAIDYHTFRFGQVNPMCIHRLIATPPASINYVLYMAWYIVYSRCPLEVMARRMGIELDPPSLPEPEASRRGAALGHLVAGLDPAAAGKDSARAYELDVLYRVAQYAERSDRYGPALESDNLDDVARLLGHRPKSWQEADAQLEEFVLKAGPESDPDLVRLLHRRLLREEALLEPALRELQNAHMAPID